MISISSWEHRKTDTEDMLYVVMQHGDGDLAKSISVHRNMAAMGCLSPNNIRFFWEEMLKVLSI